MLYVASYPRGLVAFCYVRRALRAVLPAQRLESAALQHLFHEGAAFEELEVAEVFAGTDEARGDAELFLDGDDDAAFAAAIELGDDEAGEAGGFLEDAGLGDGVAAGGGVDNEEALVGGRWGLSSAGRAQPC